jgi:hypothetical protein
MKSTVIVCSLCSILFAFSVDAQQTCCPREVAITDVGEGTLDWTIESVLHQDAKNSDCHEYDFMSISAVKSIQELDDEIGKLYGADPDPEAQKALAELLWFDYLLQGDLVTTEAPEGPDTSTLQLRFFDPHRGEVVKEGRTSWSGTAGFGQDAVGALVVTFLPLDELMYDYERIPEKATVRPARDPIEAGERMTIHVRNVVDSKNRPSQPWQWILARAEKGKILNGEPQGEGFRRFEVGDGSIELSYRAPDICKNQTETIMIYNSCNNDPRMNVNFIPEREIITGSFEIHCVPKTAWKGTITYTRSYNQVQKGPGPHGRTVENHEIVNEKADLEVHGWTFSHSYDGSIGTDLYYEGEDGSLTGTYSGTYKKIVTIEDPEEGTVTMTDTALCQAMIQDSGYLLINNEEMRSSLDFGLSYVGDEPCHGTTVISTPRGSQTLDFDWDQFETFAGLGFLESSISAKNPRAVTGSYSLPEWGITWTWNLRFSGP